jgi:formylglycine-generating enzyme required for sulfatase activity
MLQDNPLKARILYAEARETLSSTGSPQPHDVLAEIEQKLAKAQEASKDYENYSSIYDLAKSVTNYMKREANATSAEVGSSEAAVNRWEDGKVAGQRRAFRLGNVEFAFRWIPAGSALLGSDNADPCHAQDECQWRAVFSRGFWMQETEFTRGQYQAVTGRDGDDECPTCPESAYWYKAMEVAAALNKRTKGDMFRLPTEAEWEYASRAESDGEFGGACWPNSSTKCLEMTECVDTVAWWSGRKEVTGPQPAGGKRPNKWGLVDMHGNVWEWCLDIYDDFPVDSATDYASTSGSWGEVHILRGGGYHQDHASVLRSAFRRPQLALAVHDEIGFRLARGGKLQFSTGDTPAR